VSLLPPFLSELLDARSPSGEEGEAQAVFDRHLDGIADEYSRDALGNRFATLNPRGSPKLMLTGHLDELGLMITYVDADGFLYFNTIGGHDRTVISGRRVVIQAASGKVIGVTGKRAVHLMDEADRKKVPEIHEIWIDIGARSRREALERVRVGDSATYDHRFSWLHGSLGVARAFDDKVGAYVAAETLLRLAKKKDRITASVVAVGTVQEEIGLRGAGPAAFGLKPDVAIAIDVTHATDHPDCDLRKYGDIKLGGGPVLMRGPNVHPLVYLRLIEAAERAKVPVQTTGKPRPTDTDANPIQVAGAGIATGLIGIPLRYMHTPSEIVDLKDVEKCVAVLVEFAGALKAPF
jgi:putative aminopeptidase FrvX